ncbi:MAG: hypothetical protein AAGG99_06155 [Pseudomonadota bacterium]
MPLKRLTSVVAVVTVVGAITVMIGAFAPVSWIAGDTAGKAQRELAAIAIHNRHVQPRYVDRSLIRKSSHGDAEQLYPDTSLRVGDRITVAGQKGLKRVLEVVSLRRTSLRQATPATRPGSVPEAEDAGALYDLIIVTARDVENPSARTVRFLIDDVSAPERHASDRVTARTL